MKNIEYNDEFINDDNCELKLEVWTMLLSESFFPIYIQSKNEYNELNHEFRLILL